MRTKTIFLGILIVIAAVVVGMVYYQNLQLQKEDTTTTPSGVMVEESKTSNEEAIVDGDEQKDEALVMEIAEKAMTATGSLSVELADVSGGTSTGTAYLVREDGELFHTVTATLPDPGEGMFYEGWLVTNDPEFMYISTGKMTLKADGTYELNFTSSTAYEGYNEVVITLEEIDDGEPETHVLEGTVN